MCFFEQENRFRIKDKYLITKQIKHRGFKAQAVCEMRQLLFACIIGTIVIVNVLLKA